MPIHTAMQSLTFGQLSFGHWVDCCSTVKTIVPSQLNLNLVQFLVFRQVFFLQKADHITLFQNLKAEFRGFVNRPVLFSELIKNFSFSSTSIY